MRFKCRGCGDCCRNFGEQDKCIPLFPWEVEELEKLARKNNLSIEFKPIKYLFDKKSKIIFIYLYGIKNCKCPFLNKNKCSIYEHRPIICRQFPLLWIASQYVGKEFGASCLSECSCFDCKKDFESNLPIGKYVGDIDIDVYLNKNYPKCFDYALLGNRLGRKILEIIGKHDGLGNFELVEVFDKDFENYSFLSLPEFLKLRGFYDDLLELEKIYFEKAL